MSALDGLTPELSEVWASLSAKRKVPRRDGNYSMGELGRSALFARSPPFLVHRWALAEGHGQPNRETLFGMSTTPSAAYIRLMLGGVPQLALGGLFNRAREAAGAFAPFQCLSRRVLIALD